MRISVNIIKIHSIWTNVKFGVLIIPVHSGKYFWLSEASRMVEPIQIPQLAV